VKPYRRFTMDIKVFSDAEKGFPDRYGGLEYPVKLKHM
jgi:hypothetical protein